MGRFADPPSAWRMLDAGYFAGPARERIAKAVIARVSTYEEDGRVRIPGVARCIIGTKQGRPDWSEDTPATVTARVIAAAAD